MRSGVPQKSNASTARDTFSLAEMSVVPFYSGPINIYYKCLFTFMIYWNTDGCDLTSGHKSAGKKGSVKRRQMVGEGEVTGWRSDAELRRVAK